MPLYNIEPPFDPGTPTGLSSSTKSLAASGLHAKGFTTVMLNMANEGIVRANVKVQSVRISNSICQLNMKWNENNPECLPKNGRPVSSN